MKVRFYSKIGLAVLLIAMGTVGCGSDGSDFFGGETASFLNELSLRDRTTPAGGTNSVRVEVSVGNRALTIDSSESQPFDLGVLIPAGTAFVDGTSKISDSLFGDALFGKPDHRGPNRVGVCDDGRTFVFYHFSAGEFEDTDSLDGGTIVVKFDVAVSTQANGKFVEATVFDLGGGELCPAGSDAAVKFVVG